jgi:two-component system response regulator DesR
MAVLREPVEVAHVLDRQPRIIVSAANGEADRRIMTALTYRGLRASLQVDAGDESSDLATDSTAIVVLACDVNLPGEMAALRRLHRELRKPALVVVSPSATGTGVRRALDAGADAVVFESELEATLAVAISAVASGQSVVPRELRASVERPALSHRERQVLAYVSTGLTNAQIAVRLFLAESTIKSHLSSAFAKLGVRSRREAAAIFRTLEQPTSSGPEEPERPPAEAAPKQATT